MNRSLIFRNANKLVKQGFTRSEAMREAWRLAKLPEISVKVKGTAATAKRQEALEHLTRYSPELVSFRIAGQPDNPADPNAVAVVATVKGKGSFISDDAAADTAVIMSAKKDFKAAVKAAAELGLRKSELVDIVIEVCEKGETEK